MNARAPLCSLLAAQVDPGDLQELFQQTSASVFRINSHGESVPGPSPPQLTQLSLDSALQPRPCCWS